MSSRRLFLLGALRAEVDGRPCVLAGQKVVGLLAYLALYPLPQPREVLAELFWPDAALNRARRSLADALYRLRRALGDGWLDAAAEQIALSPSPDVWVDVWEFDRLVAVGDPASLQQAQSLYLGDLLPELYDDWLLPLRVSRREKYLSGLQFLGQAAEALGQSTKALDHYRQLAQADPLREEAQRGLMRNLGRLGRFAEALDVFTTLEQALQLELGIQPGLETRLLADRLRAEWEFNQRATAHPAPARFVGRVTERARLLALLDRAREGHGGLAVIVGEPGIGKSRLLEELAQAAGWRGWQVAWGRGDEFHLPAAYAPFAQALAEALPPARWGQLARLVPEVSLALLATLIPNLPTIPLTTVTPTQVQHAVLNVLHGLQTISPHLLLLDDVQWADDQLWSALDALRQPMRQMRLLCVLSLRRDDAHNQPEVWARLQAWDQAGVPVMHLVGLGADELRELANPQPLTSAQLERLIATSGGNPLFALDLLQSRYLDSPVTDLTASHLSLAGLALERVAKLSDRAQQALQAAAVIGAEVDYSLWEAVLIREDLPAVQLPLLAGEVERAGLLRLDRAGYRFAHDILRAALYHHLSPQACQHLHSQVLAAMRQMAPARTLDLLYHARQAEAWPFVAQYARELGEQSLSRFNYVAAVDYFTQALDVYTATEPEDRYRALVGRIRAHEILGNREAQRSDLAALHPLTELLNDPHRRMEALLLEACYLWQTGAYAQAIETASHGLALAAPTAHAETRAALLEVLGQAARDQGHYPQAREWFGQALALHQNLGNLAGEASILDLLGIVAQRQGNLPEAIKQQARALDLYRNLGDVHKQGYVLGNLGIVYWMSGDYARARGMFEQALDINRQIGEMRAEVSHLSNLGALYGIAGDLDKALEHYDLALERLGEAGDKAMGAMLLGNRSYALYDLGRLDEALAAADQALALNQELGRRRGEGFTQHTRGLILTELDRLAEAQKVFQACLDLRRSLGEGDTLSDTYSSLAILYLKQGALSLAEQAFDSAHQTLPEHGNLEYRRNFHYTGYLVCQRREEPASALAHLLQAEEAMLMIARELPESDQRRFLNALAINRQIQQAVAQHSQRVDVRLVRADVPIGKRLASDDYASITWTLARPGDEALTPASARRQHILRRLLSEASAQGAAPTDDDLARALSVSRRTILRDIQALQTQGIDIQTRQRGQGERL